MADSFNYRQKHDFALRMAHLAFQNSLCSPTWGADDFYSAMAVYRKAAGIELGDDDEMLDSWLDGADAVWKQEVRAKGDKISLGEVLEKAIEAGIKAVGLRL